MKKKNENNYNESPAQNGEGFVFEDNTYDVGGKPPLQLKRIAAVICLAAAAVFILAYFVFFRNRSGGSAIPFSASTASSVKAEAEQKKKEKEAKKAFNSENSPWFSTDGYGRLFFDGSQFSGTELVIPSAFDGSNINTVSFGFDEKNTTVKTLKVNEGVRVIREGAFSKFTALQKVSLPNSLERIIGNCFHGTPWYKSLNSEFCVFGKGVLIKYCGNSKSIVVPQNVITLDCEVFKNCDSADSIVFSESTVCVGTGVFEGCTAENIVVNSGLQKADNNAFSGSAWLKSKSGTAVVGKGVMIRCDINGDVIEIPDSVKYISGLDLKGNGDGITMIIGKNVVDVADFRELGYVSEFKVDKESTVFSARSGVLYNADKTVLYRYPVYRNASSFRATEDLTRIGNCAFYDSSLEHIEVYDGVLTLGNEAFKNCKKLKEFVMPGTVNVLGHSVFENCAALKEIQLSEVLRKIPFSTFANCKSLEKLSLNSNLAYFGARSFENCASLKKIELPKTVTAVAPSAFNGCDNLKLTVQSGNIYYKSEDGKLIGVKKKS